MVSVNQNILVVKNGECQPKNPYRDRPPPNPPEQLSTESHTHVHKPSAAKQLLQKIHTHTHTQQPTAHLSSADQPTNMASKDIQSRVNQIMRESTTPYLLTEDVVEKLRSKYSRDYSRVKVKELTRSVTKAVSAYRQQIKDDANNAAATTGSSQPTNGGDQSEEDAAAVDKSTPKFNLLNAGMRRRYTSTKASADAGAASPSSSSSSSSSTTSSSSTSNNNNNNNNNNSATTSNPSSSAPSKRSRRSREDGSRSGKRQRTSDAANGNNGNKGSSGAPADSSYHVESTGRYADLGGIEKCMQDVRELIEYPLSHPEIYAHLGVEPPRGILLHGPPGCGKTSLANAIAGELGVAFLRVSAPEIVSGMSGQSEQKVRSLFEEAIAKAPCLVFIDEIDAITPKRETASRGMERRIVVSVCVNCF